MLVSCSHLKLDRPMSTGEGDWSTYGRNAARFNNSTENITPPLRLAWASDLTGGVGNGSPLLVDSMVIVGTLRGELYVFDSRNGKRLGWLAFGDAIQGSPVVRDEVVFLALSNSSESIVAYDMSRGRKLWSKSYGDIEVSPVLADNHLYFGNIQGEFFCIDADEGNEVWRFSVPANTKLKGIRSSAAVSGPVVVFGCDDGILYGLDAATGSEAWTYDTGHPIVASPCIMDGVAFVGNTQGSIIAIDVASGSSRWRSDLGSPIHAGVALSDQNILVATAAGRLMALDRSGGTTVWKTELGSVINASPVVAGSYAYVGTLRKILYGVNVASGEIVFQEPVEGRIKSAPAVGFGKLFVASDERWIFAFEEGRQE
jgi:outer membrane protein assembly factor BamB